MNPSTQNSSASLRADGQTVSFGQRKVWDNERDLPDVVRLLDREYKDVIPFADIQSRMMEWNFIPREHIVEACDTLKSLCDSQGNISLHILLDQLTGFPEASEKDDMDANIDTLEAYKIFDHNNKGCIDLEGLRKISNELGEELDDETLTGMLNLATQDVFRKQQNIVSRDDFFSLVKSKVLN
ncbi:putative EF hand protein [Cryptosporidium canis]|uniref:EF hand protein n=1 Tax=Cryptosporidium canis TaxID=195482 RepID=A0A9D5HXQ1_9CRYT|nr:putative EF hand protein [Cryptosporidium canis]